jgi:hypothetical protein
MRVLFLLLGIVIACGAQTPAPKIPYDGTPLLKTKLALELARARVREDRFQDAASALRDAAHALADYEKLSPGPHAETAEFIRHEIEAYASKIGRNHEDAADRIDLWLERANRWAEAGSEQ